MSFVYVVLVASLPAFAADGLGPGHPLRLYPLLMDTLMVSDYGAAGAICNEIDREFPRHAAVSYARACVIYAHITDFEDTTGRAEFFQLAETAIEASKRLKHGDVTSRVVGAYIRGSARAAKALLLYREGSLMKALRLMMSARGDFQEAIEADPTFYDAYLGRGAYRYGVATNASMLSWLPLIPSVEEGWDDLWLAADSARFSKYSALSAMVWFVMQEKDWELADSICQAGLTRFPGCRSFLWAKLALHQRRRQWAKAEQAAHELLGQYLAHADNNGYDTIGLYATLMTCADSLQRPKDAVEYARQGLMTFCKSDVLSRRKDKLDLLDRRLTQAGMVRPRNE